MKFARQNTKHLKIKRYLCGETNKPDRISCPAPIFSELILRIRPAGI